MEFEKGPNEPDRKPINPLLKLALELGPLGVFFFANARGEWLAERFPALGELGGPLFTATALFTVEGENDDISGVGQTEAAHRLCSSLPAEMKAHHVEPVVGHYGVFNGSRWRQGIAPKIAAFIRAHDEAPGRKAGTAR